MSFQLTLDFARGTAQKQFQVHLAAPNFYAVWRAKTHPGAALRDGNQPPPEKLLQAIWQHQRLRRDQLRTLDGQPIRVLHPGFGSVEGGPDFRGAVIRFGDASPLSGDIEVDLRAAGWRAHGHDQNPAFQNVILHVIWEGKTVAAQPPAISLTNSLDSPIEELALQLEHNSLRTLPDSALGKCCAPLRDLNPAALQKLLHAAALVRLQNKAAAFRARAQWVGWEQALWEGLFRALGYRHNSWPMQQLAEARPRWLGSDNSVLTLQARLLGLSGLLPAELSRTTSTGDDYLRSLWDTWWRDRDALADWVLPRRVWRLHGLRPANHPQRRLALAAYWAHDKTFVTQIESWCQRPIPSAKLLASLAKIFAVTGNDFWFYHWTFRSEKLQKPQLLLGKYRVSDLAINVVLPWLHARAASGKNAAVQSEMEKRFALWPAGEDNSILKLARQRLLGKSAAAGTLKTASAQQGLLQIVRDFCGNTDATCAGCQFPDLVRNWKADLIAPA